MAWAEQRSRHEWNQTSLLAAIAVNTSMAKQKGRRITPADFNPWTKIDEDAGRRVRFTPEYLDKLIAQSEAATKAKAEATQQQAPPAASDGGSAGGGWGNDDTKQPS